MCERNQFEVRTPRSSARDRVVTHSESILARVVNITAWGSIYFYWHPMLRKPNLREVAEAASSFPEFWAPTVINSPERECISCCNHLATSLGEGYDANLLVEATEAKMPVPNGNWHGIKTHFS